MRGRDIGIVAVVGLLAFAAAFGVAKAGGGDDKAKKAATPSATPGTVALKPVEVAPVKIRGVSAGGDLARFKSPKKKKATTDSGDTPVVTATPGPTQTTTPQSTATAVPTFQATQVPTQEATPAPTEVTGQN